jgi:hypothetical protein
MQHLPMINQRASRSRFVGTRLCATAAASLVLFAAGCARNTGGASTPSVALGGGGPGSQVISNPETQKTAAMNLANLAISAKTEIPLGMNEAWSRLQAAYASLGLQLTVRDEKQHVIGNTSFRARRKVADVELRHALECGGTPGTPNAESYDITMGIRSQLVSLSQDKVQLETFVDGLGRNALTNNSTVVTCITQGVFEKKIAEMVRTGVIPTRK